MSSTPFFSIIVPTYNRAGLIGQTINGVLNQTYINWELLIVDDGSTDNTKQVVTSYNDSRIKYIYQQNAERSAARNNGIRHSAGKYICFVDSDDYYLPNRLQQLYDSIQALNEPVAFFYTDIAFDKNGVLTNKMAGACNTPNVHDFISTAILGNPQACIHRNILIKHQFNPNFRIGEDMELWHRIVEEYKPIYLPNQITVIAGDHDDRSVNEKRSNSFTEHKQTLDFIFAPNHAGHKTSALIKKQKYSSCYFGIAKYYIYNRKKAEAAYWLLKSIFVLSNHPQTKYKLNILLHVFTSPEKAEQLIQQ